jgi:hypothetical protein
VAAANQAHGTRWQSSETLSPAAEAVLKNAFDSDFSDKESRANAYQFPMYSGSKEMAPWTFPGDFNDEKNRGFTLSYEDMLQMLRAVQVRGEISSLVWIPYAQMLQKSVANLSPTILNADTQGIRTLKVIYCIRNFSAVAEKYQLTRDRYYLSLAAQQLLELAASGRLQQPNISRSGLKLDGSKEQRSISQGLAELGKKGQ